jgi:hypothetical protein
MMAIRRRTEAERIVEISLRMARATELATTGRVVREDPAADCRPVGRVTREEVRPGVLMSFGCVVRQAPAQDARALGRVVRKPHP